VYRYFPTKRDLFAAVYMRASERLLETSELMPGLTLAEQVLAGLDAHFDFFIENARTVLVANRGELAGDPMIEGIISEELGELRKRMLDAGGLHGRERVRASIALSGWLAFVRAVCVEWLADPSRALSREEVRDMCLSALLSALRSETTKPHRQASPPASEPPQTQTTRPIPPTPTQHWSEHDEPTTGTDHQK
jgi:AcrR family transcriptional regulator